MSSNAKQIKDLRPGDVFSVGRVGPYTVVSAEPSNPAKPNNYWIIEVEEQEKDLRLMGALTLDSLGEQ